MSETLSVRGDPDARSRGLGTMLILCSRTAVGCETSASPDCTLANDAGSVLLDIAVSVGAQPIRAVPFSTFVRTARCPMAVVYRTEQLGKTVSTYPPCHEIHQSDGLSVLWPALGAVWPCKRRRVRWRAGMRSHSAPKPLEPARKEVSGHFCAYLDRHIPGPPAFLRSVSVAPWCPGD